MLYFKHALWPLQYMYAEKILAACRLFGVKCIPVTPLSVFFFVFTYYYSFGRFLVEHETTLEPERNSFALIFFPGEQDSIAVRTCSL